MNQKIALITGITGQDGSILAQQLLQQDYTVYGLIRRTTNRNLTNIEDILDDPKFHLVQGDLADQNSIARAIDQSNCYQLYHLGAQSFVAESFKTPENTANITGLGTLRVLEAVRQSGRKDEIRVYNAGSSQMFGKMVQNPANEDTPFYPRSPYGVAKVFGYHMTRNYREAYDMFAVSGILFNHESFKRGVQFLPKKITTSLKNIIEGKQEYIQLGNIKAQRDWGAAQYYTRAMQLMLRQDEPKDYVVATGETHSVQEFLQIAFDYVGISDWQSYVKINPKFFRPAQVQYLRGNSSRIREQLGWDYDINFKELIYNMLDQQFGKPNKFL